MNYDISYFAYAVEITLAIQVIIASAELLMLYSSYSDVGLLSWQIQRTGPKVKIYVKKLRLDILCKYPNVLGILLLRLLCAIAIPILIFFNQSVLLVLLIITAINLVMQLRNSQSNDGSDQMAVICFISLLLANCIHTDLSMSFALFFIAAQSSIAYGTSGFLKMKKIGWYNGEYVIDVLKTSSYGNREVLQLTLKRRWIAKILGLMVVYGDCLLSLAFAFPPNICIFILIFGVFIHAGIGRVMGLNTFFWSYVATYPAILYVSYAIYGM